MSVEAIVAAVEAAARTEVAAILDAADRAAAEQIAAAEAQHRRRLDAAVREEDARLRAWAARTLNAARLRVVGRRMVVAAAVSEAAFATARTELARITDEPAGAGRWAAALRRFADEAGAVVGPRGELRLRPADAALLAGHAGAMEDAAAVIVADPALGPGLIARSADGSVVVDATLAARLIRAETLLGPRVAALLVGSDR